MRLGLTVLLSFLLGFAARADEYEDTKARFRVSVPHGWTKTVRPADGVDLSLDSPRAPETFGSCSVHSSPLPGTETISQAEIDERLTGKFTESFWLSSFKGSGMNDVVVEASGEETQHGHNTYYAVANYDEAGFRIKFKAVAHFVPGRAFNLFCAASVAAYAREDGDFEVFFDSFNPIDTGLIANLPPSGPRATLAAISHNALDLRRVHTVVGEKSREMRAMRTQGRRK